MNLSTVLIIVVIILITIVFNKVFGDNLDKITKVILYGFIPYGIVMWLFEIIISKHIWICQFGLILTAFDLGALASVKSIKFLQNKFNSSNGRAIGFCYSVLVILAFLLVVFTKIYIETYFEHTYSFP